MAGVALHPRLDVLEAEGCLESLGAVSLLDTKDPESSSGRRGLGVSGRRGLLNYDHSP